jgi:hypothetical protein
MRLSKSLLPIGLALAAIPLAALAEPDPFQATDRGERPLRLAEAAKAEEAKVTILAPASGAKVQAGQPVALEYRVVPGPQGDHVHVYVDGTEVAVVKQLEGSYQVAPLEAGPHELAIKIVNRGHVPIGVESSVKVEAR